MRDIKFRGKILDSNEWVYGYYECTNGGRHAIALHNSVIPMDYQVYQKTVGQYTGLKDKNGKEIYEGDVLKTFPILSSDNLGSDCFNVTVYWGESSWIANGSLSRIQCGISEVIGNIHETP